MYKYPKSWLDLGKIEIGCTKRFMGFATKRRSLFKKYPLTPGVYVSWIKIDFDERFEKDFEVNLAIYSEYPCKINVAQRNDVIDFTGNPNIEWKVEKSKKSRKSHHFGKWDERNLGANTSINMTSCNLTISEAVGEEDIS